MLRERTKSQLAKRTFLPGDRCCSPHSAAICSFVIHGWLEEPAWRPETTRQGQLKKDNTANEEKHVTTVFTSLKIPDRYLISEVIRSLKWSCQQRNGVSNLMIRNGINTPEIIPDSLGVAVHVHMLIWFYFFLLHLHKTKDSKHYRSSKLDEESLRTLRLLSHCRSLINRLNMTARLFL